MRMALRDRTRIFIAPRVTAADALGGAVEVFSTDRVPVDALLAPTSKGYRNHETGQFETRTIGLLMDGCVALNVGDGICLESDEPRWCCCEVVHWPHHTAAQIRRIGAFAP